MSTDVVQLDERIAKCQKILETDPNSQIFAALADGYRKKGKFQKALAICKAGLEKHPDYAPAYIVLVKVFADQGDYEEADRYLQKAIAVGGRTRSVDLMEAEILIKLGRKHKAKGILTKLHRSDPRNEAIKDMLSAVESETSEPPVAEPPPQPAEPATETPRSKKYTLSNALAIIKVSPRVLGVIAVSRDGMFIEGRFEGGLPKDELAVLASGSFDAVAQSIAKIDLGLPLEIMIETIESKLWIKSWNRILIVVATRDDVNFGSLRLKVNDVLAQTEE